MSDPATPAGLLAEFAAAVYDALNVPIAAVPDLQTERDLRERRALLVRSASEIVRDARNLAAVTEAIASLRVRTSQLPALYRQYRATADTHPGDCVICGPGCCNPFLGVHGSCPGPHVGATVVSG